jgi:protein-export membrane protein SecD
MQGRFKWWIAAVIALFVVGFLIAFAPLRPAPRGFQVQTVFKFSLPQPVVDDQNKLDSVSGQLAAELRDKVTDLNYAKFTSTTEIEVATFATTEQNSAQDHQTVLQALQGKYPGVKEEALAQSTEKPVWTLGTLLAVYAPRPQIRLGLDLQGGAQVVLLARPETTSSFLSPEDRPMAKLPPAGEGGAGPKAAPTEAAAAGQPSGTNVQTPEELGSNLLKALAQQGVAAQYIGQETLPPNRILTVARDANRQITASVEVVAPYHVLVRTRAKNQQEAERDQNAALRYLQNAYPGVEIKNDKTNSVFVEKGTADKIKEIVERRLYASDIREPVIQTQGDDRVIVELPGVKDPAKVVELLGTTALLQFMLIPEKYQPPQTEDSDYATWTNKYTHQDVPWEQVYAESDSEFTGADLKANARVQPGQAMDLVVGFELRNERKDAFRRFTGHNVGRYMAIVLDGKCQMAPVIRSEIPGAGIIEGKFSPDQAAKLSLLLNAGALPVPLEIAENRTVSATLGADSIRQSLIAGLVGFALVVAFMVLAYRVPGALANIALILYLVLLTAALKLANATLTLPGIAGFIMSLGMAVDANILIFERLKEELYSGKTARAAIVAGFERAWTAILDANVTTLIGAAVLYFLGTSAIKSFAVILFLGVIVHLFTAVTVSRWLVTMFAHTRLGQRLSYYGVPKPE